MKQKVVADRIISVQEAARIRNQTTEAIIKAVRTKRLIGIPLSGKGILLSERQVLGKSSFDEAEFRFHASQYCSVPEACNITWKTDAAVIRDLKKGTIKGFRLNGKSWAVLRRSAEEEFRNYLENHHTRVGRKRDIGFSKSPRDLRKKRLKKANRRLQSQ